MAGIIVEEDLFSQVRALTTCPICMDTFKNPKVLPCQHTFCLQCLTQCYQSHNEQRYFARTSIRCPTCRDVWTGTLQTLSKLPGDFKVGQILELVESLDQCKVSDTKDASSAVCSVCCYKDMEVRAEFFCVECTKQLCRECSMNHSKTTIFQKHLVYPLKTEHERNPNCTAHNVPISYYCRQCECSLCTICILTLHKNHDVVTEELVFNERKLFLKTKENDYMEKNDDYSSNLRLIQELCSTHLESYEETVTRINQQRQNAVESINRQATDILRDLEASNEEKQKLLLSTEVFLKQTSQTLGEIQSFFPKLNDLSYCTQSLEQLNKVYFQMTNDTSEMRFKLPSDLLIANKFKENENITLGELQKENLKVESTSNRNNSLRRNVPRKYSDSVFDDNKRQSFTRKEQQSYDIYPRNDANQRSAMVSTLERQLRRRSSQLGRNRSMSSASVMWRNSNFMKCTSCSFTNTSNEIIVVDNDALSNDKIKMFSEDGNLMLSLSGDSVVRPWGVCYNPTLGLAICTDQEISSVNLVKLHSSTFDIVQVKTTMQPKPTGIAINSRSQYVISDTSAHSSNKIVIYDPNVVSSRLTTVLPISSSRNEEYGIVKPSYLTVDHHDRIIVSDPGDCNIKIFSRDGELLLKFALSTASGLEMIPQGVAVDNSNNIFVADQALKAVSMFSPEGQLIEHVVFTEKAPRGISFCNNKKFLSVCSGTSMELHRF